MCWVIWGFFLLLLFISMCLSLTGGLRITLHGYKVSASVAIVLGTCDGFRLWGLVIWTFGPPNQLVGLYTLTEDLSPSIFPVLLSWPGGASAVYLIQCPSDQAIKTQSSETSLLLLLIAVANLSFLQLSFTLRPW